MKKFLINSLLFALIIIVISLPVNYFLWLNYFKSYETVDLKYDSYLMADSHGLRLSNNLEPYNIYNLSAGSDSYFDMFRKTKYLIRNTKVKRIIITCDDHVLSEYRELANNLDRSAFYSNADDYDNYYDYIKNKYIVRYFAFFNPKGGKVFTSYITSLPKSDSTAKKPGWASRSEKEKYKRALNRAEMQFPEGEESVKLRQKLEEIIQLCKANNIELVGLKFPLTDDYFQIIKPLIKKKEISAEQILRENNIKVLDFMDVFGDKDNYFDDQDHLNTEGSKVFTGILMDKLKHI